MQDQDGRPNGGAVPESEVTRLLKGLANGSTEPLDGLFLLVYQDLRRLAAMFMRRENGARTLQTTALVHEAYLRLVNQRDVDWQNKAHFFGIAAQAMRRILVDHARARLTGKRGGDWERVPLDEELILMSIPQSENLLSLNEALARLQEMSPRQSQIIELLFFGGLTQQEAAEILGISAKTINREWRLARAWLCREIEVVT